MTSKIQEACQVYIEQEIEEGLKQGKTPYSIGQDISTWVSKLFEVKLNPKTIEKRAERQRVKSPTSVVKKSEDDHSRRVGNFRSRANGTGGKREGAGRPRIERPNPEVERMVDKLHNFINELDQIRARGSQNLNKADHRIFDQEFKYLIPRLLRILTEMGIDIEAIMKNYVNKLRRIENGQG
jgi:hypothetical protein